MDRRGQAADRVAVVPAVIYRGAMLTGADARRYGTVFNDIAGEYDRHRPSYPDALIDRACEVADIGPGAPVLEIGCGTGQLTRSLLERGLRVTAVEPGEQLIARARDQLQGAGEVQFVNASLEDASLPRAHYRAVFCRLGDPLDRSGCELAQGGRRARRRRDPRARLLLRVRGAAQHA